MAAQVEAIGVAAGRGGRQRQGWPEDWVGARAREGAGVPRFGAGTGCHLLRWSWGEERGTVARITEHCGHLGLRCPFRGPRSQDGRSSGGQGRGGGF